MCALPHLRGCSCQSQTTPPLTRLSLQTLRHQSTRAQPPKRRQRRPLSPLFTQVVIVAAGFDTRAYRLGRGRAGVKFFEVDLPHASAKKRALVEKLFPADEVGVGWRGGKQVGPGPAEGLEQQARCGNGGSACRRGSTNATPTPPALQQTLDMTYEQHQTTTQQHKTTPPTHITTQYPRPAFIGADLAKVDLADALEGSGFDARAPTLFLIEVIWVCVCDLIWDWLVFCV